MFPFQTFQKYGCQGKSISVKRDLRGHELLSAMEDFQSELNSTNRHEIDFCIVCIIGHGRVNPHTNLEEIIGVDGKGVTREALEETINNGNKCPTMLGKPKIFLINACRGMEDNNLVPVPEKNPLDDSGIDSDSKMGRCGSFSENSWHIVLSSTVRGKTSLRHKDMGSFFIQIFCHTMKQFGEYCTFTQVIQKSSKMVQAIIGQVPSWTSCIPEEFYFSKSVPL